MKEFSVFFVWTVHKVGMFISKGKLISIKVNKTHQWRKIWKQRNPKNRRKYVQKVHLKTSCNKSLGKLKERKKNPIWWESSLTRGTLGQGWFKFIYLFTFHLRFSWRYCAFENKCSTRSKEKRIKETSLTTSVLWFSWCAHLRSWLHYYKEKEWEIKLKENLFLNLP